MHQPPGMNWDGRVTRAVVAYQLHRLHRRCARRTQPLSPYPTRPPWFSPFCRAYSYPGFAGPPLGKPNTGKPAPHPVFRFKCDRGCAPCRVFSARRGSEPGIVEACRLCLRAAARLEGRPPRPPSPAVLRHFEAVFGHNPPSPTPPGPARPRTASSSPANFRIVAEALRRADTLSHSSPCRIANNGCRHRRPRCSRTRLSKRSCSSVRPFWRPHPPLKAGVLVHEMFHLPSFPPFFSDCPAEDLKEPAPLLRGIERSWPVIGLPVGSRD